MCSSILIAGAGIGGLSAALALAQAGQQTLVLERASVLSEVGAGLQLSPNATRRLKNWGVLERLEGKASKLEAVDFFDGPSGRRLTHLPTSQSEKLWNAPYLAVHRVDLLQALKEEALRRPEITIVLGAELDGWRDTDSGVLALILDGRAFTGVALIGADGVRSRVRHGLELREKDAPTYTGRTAWRALIPIDALEPRWRALRGGLRMGAKAHLVHYPLRDQSVLNVVAIVEQPDMENAHADDNADDVLPDADRQFLMAHFNDWSADARALIAAAPSWRRWPLYVRASLRSWGSRKIVLLGDAAHAMSPFLAQGAGQAIEDADALGQAFSSHADDITAALRVYQTKRVDRALRIQDLSTRQAKIYHLPAPLSSARNAVMRLIGPQGMARASDWLFRV